MSRKISIGQKVKHEGFYKMLTDKETDKAWDKGNLWKKAKRKKRRIRFKLKSHRRQSRPNPSY